jgi:hypothetical protein
LVYRIFISSTTTIFFFALSGGSNQRCSITFIPFHARQGFPPLAMC